MHVEKKDSNVERRLTTAAIVDPALLARLASQEVKSEMGSRWSSTILDWCIDYFDKYGKAPGRAIEGIFESWAETERDKDTVALVERFLASLSGEYARLKKESNSDYLIDLASKHFNRVRLDKLADQIRGDVDRNDLAKALKRVESFSMVEIGAKDGIDILEDKAAIKHAFAQKSKPLIVYPDALGNFFADSLERDSFIAFQAPEKRGKSFWLIDMAWRGMQQRNKVAFFAVGDMSESQMLLRFMARACCRPYRATSPDKPVLWPISIQHDAGDQFAEVSHERFDYEDALTWKEAWGECKRVMAKYGEGNLRMACYPAGTVGVKGIAAQIRSWERKGWGPPDVIVIDYADLLAPPSGFVESRDQINATWLRLRSLSQSLHCLIVTATQADAQSYGAVLQSMKNFSGDKRKNAHALGIVAINQTSTEKRVGLQRLSWTVLRENDFEETAVCHVAGCLAVSNPAVLSIF
jgi:hypothetical protein